MTARFIVTIDGPAGTGKSSVAQEVAAALGLAFLDTGAMYRAAALAALEGRIDPNDGRQLAAALVRDAIRMDYGAEPPRVLLGGRDVSSRIRRDDVNAIVSLVAAQHAVRELLVEQQRRIAEEHPRLVTEGRDQGSVVFPDAQARFYLDAPLEIRARRRIEQLRAEGVEAEPAAVLASLRARDEIDSSRLDSPLRIPEGAIVVQTGNLDRAEVVRELVRAVQRITGAAGCPR